MKTFIKYRQIAVAILLLAMSASAIEAQTKDTVTIEVNDGKPIIHIQDGNDKVQVVVTNVKVDVSHNGDTTSVITIGKHRFEVIEKDHQTKLRMTRLPDTDFKGHLAGFEMGMNNLVTSGFSTSFPADQQFMELNMAKSINVGINFLQYSIPLTARNNFGLVTGCGFNFSNYRFENPYLLKRDETTGKTVGIPVDDNLLEKSKLVTTFINFPVMLEKQFASSNGKKGAYLALGGFFGLKTGSHTKVIYDDKKDKLYGNLNIRPYQCGLSFRGGYRWLNLYANYNLTPLFEDEKGPVVYPFTVGLMLVRF